MREAKREGGGKTSNVWGDNHTALSWACFSLFFIVDLNICLVVSGDGHSCLQFLLPSLGILDASWQGEEEVNFSYSGS